MKKHRKHIPTVVSFILAVTLSYFVWLSWDKLTELIGSSLIVWGITGLVVFLAWIGNYLTLKGIMERLG